MQLRYLLRKAGHPRGLALLIVFLEGATALAIISVAAYLTKLPLLFPPLGPSAYILFRVPMSEPASPRSVILSHGMALLVGLLTLHVFATLFPTSGLLDHAAMNWPRIAALSLAMGVVSAVMIMLRCSHPPAAATALIAAMGFFSNIIQILGFLLAVILLVAHAFASNRLLSGLPYPVWRLDSKIARRYGTLAGIPDQKSTFWGQLTSRAFERRHNWP